MYKCYNVFVVYYLDYLVDLGFVIDLLIFDDMWSNVLFYVRVVIDLFDIFFSRICVGVIVFSDYVKIVFLLNVDYIRVGV